LGDKELRIGNWEKDISPFGKGGLGVNTIKLRILIGVTTRDYPYKS